MSTMAPRLHEPRSVAPRSVGSTLRRKCAGCGDSILTATCPECSRERLQRKETSQGAAIGVPSIVHDVLRSPGRPLDANVRAFMEPRLGHDFSQVRVHADARAAESAHAVNALAYTVGRDVVFGANQFAPAATSGRRLLAHELAHVAQQASANPTSGALTIDAASSPAEHEADAAADAVARGGAVAPQMRRPAHLSRAPCTAAAICGGGPVAGSAKEADITGTSTEISPRARRKKMTPTRARATGHGGRALQLEKLIEKDAPGKLSSLQGVFIDQDISGKFGATTTACDTWIAESLPPGSPPPPGMAGATKQCTFVHDDLNQQALAFNKSADATIGGVPRERWHAETLELLIHETEHPRFDVATAALPAPAGVTSATCTRASVSQELSEIAATLSEFPTAFQSAAAEADAKGPLHQSLDQWFENSAVRGGENIKSALEQMGCQCACTEVDAFVIETFNFGGAAWPVAQRDALHRELKKAKWGLRWPLAPSTP